MRITKMISVTLFVFIAVPLALHAALWFSREHPTSWATADWSSTGTLPPPRVHAPAIVRVYAARTGRWKGVFATHSWIVLKEKSARSYERWDKVGWGSPVRRNNYPPDGRWYGNEPELLFEARGSRAERLIPQIRAGVAAYAFDAYGDYRIWPGPNSNTFVASVLASIPELAATLPPTAIGKDFPANGRWAGLTPSRTGVWMSLGGYVGVTLGWVDGVEINILGLVVGLDIRRPALKLPGLGRIGVPADS